MKIIYESTYENPVTLAGVNAQCNAGNDDGITSDN